MAAAFCRQHSISQAADRCAPATAALLLSPACGELPFTVHSQAWHQRTAGEPIDKYCARLLKATGVLLLPATLYEHEESTDRGHFRLGLGRSNFAECMDKWQTFIETDR